MQSNSPSLMDAIATAKRELRAAMLTRRRDQPSANRAGAGERLRDHFVSSCLPAAGTAVSGYWPIGDEIDVRPLMAALRAHGCPIALPVVAAKARPLIFRAWREGDELVKAGFGLSEPPPDAPELTPKLLLVPMVAFDGAGNRLGFGGGFYDMTLAALRAADPSVRAVGVAFAFQEVESVPHDPTDQPLDAVVTEQGAVEIRRAEG